MDGRATTRVAATVSVGTVIVATIVVLGAGAAWKAPCSAGSWSDGRQYKLLCYSDIVPLYGTEHLRGNRLPFLDACPTSEGQCDEYPVLTMYFMRVAAWVGHGYGPFFWANAAGLAGTALFTAWALFRIVGRRALWFALAPTLLIYGFVNWDLLAVALAAAGTLAFFRQRDGWSGILLGLGAAAKLFPAFLVVPFALARLRQGRRQDAGVIALGAAGAYAGVNLPFVLFAPHPWSTFFRFNAARPADWDSLWFVLCQRMHGGVGCGWPAKALNVGSAILFVVLAGVVWFARRARDRDFPAWTFGFPILVLFLLTSKVYSPQYGLWLLPWFALALPNLWLFLAFEAADVAVFLTRFTWFGRYARDTGQAAFQHFHGAPLGAFEFAVVIRAAVLVVCLAAWVLGERGRHALGAAGLERAPGPALLEAGR